MHLFNNQHTCQSPMGIGKELPHNHKFITLPSNPPRNPESTAAVDHEGNVYFGCHDGIFYSLDKNFNIRWFYHTNKKIYSSPAIIKDKVVVAGGDGFLYCFNLEGLLLWKNKFVKTNKAIQIKKVLSDITSFIYLTLRRRSLHKDVGVISSWSSPNIDSLNNIYITGTNSDLCIVNHETGETATRLKLKKSRYLLSGPAIARNDLIFCPNEKKYLQCFHRNQIQWTYVFKSSYKIWATPSIDEDLKYVFTSWTIKDKKGCVKCVNFDGKEIWSFSLKEGIRCTPGLLSKDLLVFVSITGVFYVVSRINGSLIHKKRLENCVRAFWSSPCIDANGNILMSFKSSNDKGFIICIDKKLETKWKFETGKVLSTPIIKENGDVLFGTNGRYNRFSTT